MSQRTTKVPGSREAERPSKRVQPGTLARPSVVVTRVFEWTLPPVYVTAAAPGARVEGAAFVVSKVSCVGESRLPQAANVEVSSRTVESCAVVP